MDLIKVDDLLFKDISSKLVIFPTDTIYGIGTSIYDTEGINKIYDLKNRDKSKPLAVLCSSIEQVKKLVLEEESVIKKCFTFWPGPITFILRKSEKVNELVSSFSTVGIRVPNCEVTLKIIDKFGPLVATSVNISGSEAVNNIDELSSFNADYLVTDSVKIIESASTVFDVKNLQVLREGQVKKEEILKIFKKI